MSITVAIQGEEASFHHIAAKNFFGESIKIIPCKLPFSKVFEALKSSDYAVCAIETSLYGQINEVYDELRQSDAKIIGEVYIRTTQNLLGTTDSTIKKIKEIHSHPVAIAECLPYIKDNLPDAAIYETTDTAQSARLIKETNLPFKAAIAGYEAAKLHNLKILAENIDHSNYTRFVMLQNKPNPVKKPNKASLIIELQQEKSSGSLHQALGVFAKFNLNLTLIHSRPLMEKAWHYLFYVDVEGDIKQSLNKSIQELAELGNKTVVLGSYQAGYKF